MQPRIPFFDNLRVGTRLFTLVVLTLIAVGGAALLFSVADRRLETAFAEHSTALKIQEFSYEITAGIAALRSHQTAFLVSGDIRAAEAYARESARLMAVLESLGGIAQAAGIRTYIDTLHDGIAEHAVEFKKLADLDGNGASARAAKLDARTQQAAAGLEQRISELGLDSLATAALALRPFERRYLNGGGGALVEMIRYRQEVFDPRLADALLTSHERDEISTLAEAYVSALSEQGKWMAEERRIFDRLDEILGYLNPAIEALAGLRREAAAMAAEARRECESIRTLMLGGAGGIFVVIAALGALIVLGVSRPLQGLAKAAGRMADGNYDTVIPVSTARDELGDLARGLRAAHDGLAEAESLRQSRERSTRSQSLHIQVTQRALVEEIETEIAAAISKVAQAASELSQLAESVGRTAGEIARRAQDVTTASQQTTGNLRELAAAASRLHNAVAISQDGIAAMVPETAGTAHSAALTDVAWELRTFLERVANIALRTRLMALKGAIGTGGSPESEDIATEIRELVDKIANDGSNFGARIKAAVEPLADIAAATEMQGIAARDILQNAEGAVTGTLEMSNAISRITRAAKETGRVSDQLREVAAEAARQSEHLHGEVGEILTRIRGLTGG